VDGLTEVKEVMDNYKAISDAIKELNDYYASIGLNQFGEKIDKDSLKHIKDKLDELNNTVEDKDKTIKELQRKAAQDKDE